MHWFADFLYLYAFGVSAAIIAVPEKAIGRYFFKFHALGMLVLVVIATVIGRPLVGAPVAGPIGTVAGVTAIAFGVTALLLSMVAQTAKLPLRVDILLMPVSTGLMFAVFEGVHRAGGVTWGLLLAVHLITCAGVLGTSLVAMNLGHWYLNDASLSFDHLVGLTRWFVIACVAKLAVSGVYFGLGFQAFWENAFEFDGIFLWTRLLGGAVGGLVLAWMAWSCAKMKSNQSATGILYIAVMLVIVGEVMSLYLTFGRKTPL